MTLFDVATGQVQASIDMETSYPTSLAFSPDGRMLAVNQHKVVKVLDLAQIDGGNEPIRAPQLDALWRNLGSGDAAEAYRAECRMILGGEQTVAYLYSHLRPVHETPADRLEQLFRDLGNSKYATRQGQ